MSSTSAAPAPRSFQSRLAPKVNVARFVNNNHIINNNSNEFKELKNQQQKQKAEDEEMKVQEKVCICNRPQHIVMCQTCGYTIDGRVRLQCPRHPSITFLLDLVVCPQCRIGPEALREFPKPTKSVQHHQSPSKRPLQSHGDARRKFESKRRCEMQMMEMEYN